MCALLARQGACAVRVSTLWRQYCNRLHLHTTVTHHTHEFSHVRHMHSHWPSVAVNLSCATAWAAFASLYNGAVLHVGSVSLSFFLKLYTCIDQCLRKEETSWVGTSNLPAQHPQGNFVRQCQHRKNSNTTTAPIGCECIWSRTAQPSSPAHPQHPPPLNGASATWWRPPLLQPRNAASFTDRTVPRPPDASFVCHNAHVCVCVCGGGGRGFNPSPYPLPHA